MTSERKIVHVLWGLHAAGIENLALQLAANQPANVQSTLLNLDPFVLELLPAFRRLVEQGKLLKIHSMQASGFLLMFRSYRFCTQEKPDAVIIYPCDSRLLWLALGVWLARVPSAAVCVQNTAPVNPGARRKWQLVLHSFAFLRVNLVSCSNAVADSIRPLLPRSVRLPVIPNGCDVEGIAYRSRFLRSLPGREGSKRIVMVARLDQIKDQATLIKAFAWVRHDSWELHLVGDGPNRNQLEQLVLQCGLDPDVVFLGRRLDIPELLGSMDLFAMSTTSAEGFGIVMIEAMAAGLPVIASDVSACREVLGDGAAGVLVPPADVAAWAHQLRLLMLDEAGRRRLAASALRRVELYDIQTCARFWYDELMP